MHLIEATAYYQRLRNENPIWKLLFCLAMVVLCISGDKILLSLLVLLFSSCLLLFAARISPKIYGKLLLVPAGFLFLSLIAIVVQVTKEPMGRSLPLFGFYLCITKESLLAGLRLFCKSFSSVSCLYFLILTTPMMEILHTLYRFHVPKLFIELMALIYRFIFVLWDTASKITTAQNARLGYQTLRRGYHSLAALASGLFLRSTRNSERLYDAMEARCYDGTFDMLKPQYRASPLFPILLSLLFIITLAAAFLLPQLL